MAMAMALVELNFYSHTPHGVQLMKCQKIQKNSCISTHTPLTGCNL